ncbi:MAG: ABC transporter ATP-binding protein [Desulfobaccales bacterium]
MFNITGAQASLFWSYMLALCRYARGKAVVSLVLLIVLGLAQGIGLFMIIPLLHLIGLGGAADSGGVTAFIGRSLARLGLPLTLPGILCVYVALVASYAVASRFRDVLNMEIVEGFTYVLRNNLYKDLTRVDWLSFTRTRAADITHVLTAGLEMVGSGTQQVLLLVSTLVIAAVNIGVAFTLSPAMTALALGAGALLLLLLRPFNRRALRTGEELHQARNEMFAVVTDHLSGMKVAKSYGLEKRYAHHFRVATGRLMDQFIEFVHVSAATRMFYEIGAAVALSVLFLCAVEVIHLPAAYLLLMAFLFARLLPELSVAQQCYQRIRNTLPSYGAVLAMHDRLAQVQEPRRAPAGQPLRLDRGIELRRVSFRYDQTRHDDAVHQVDLMIPARQLTAITGPSGAGKSTLADLIMGLLVPDRGQVLIDGVPLEGPRLHDWRSSVGYVPQETFLFHDTVRANLQWAQPDAGEEELWRVLQLAAAAGFVAHLPQGLDTVVGDRGLRLSGGERQRLALARALLRRPSLLLLDEATSNLDVENERQIQEAVRRLPRDLTVVVIAHRLSTVRIAERIVVLDKGWVAAKGAWDQLASQPSLIRALLGGQEEISM